MSRWSERERAADRGRRIGFVPTMGCLHEGHLALVRAARRRCDRLVVSIFVNPTQFGPGEDYRTYPRSLARDRRLLRAEGVDVLFAPARAAMYRPGHSTFVDVTGLTGTLCGRHRPGHFRGVATVVAKLFAIVRPHVAVFGRKDAQQALVIERMTRDLDLDVRVVVVPTVREPDGLAMSSRNRRLTAAQRREAPVLYAALEHCRRRVRAGERSVARLRREMIDMIGCVRRARLQYLEFVDAATLRPVRRIEGRVLVAVAAHFGRVRLIDNVLVSGQNRVTRSMNAKE